MSTKSSRELQKQDIREAYFYYWRIQNNPKYIKFWEKVKSSGGVTQQQGTKEKQSWFVSQMKYFKVWVPLPDPSKKIRWENFIESPDPEIIDSMNAAYAYAEPRKRFKVMIDPESDNYEIANIAVRWANFYRAFTGIHPHGRDHIKKFHHYAMVWDLRKPPRKSFPEIASMLKIHNSTAKSMLQRAYELIFNEPFDKEAYEQKIKKLSRKNDLKLCNTCSDHRCIKDGRFKNYCPDMIFHLKQLEKSQTEKILYDDKDDKKISKIDWLSNKVVFREWQEKERND